MGVNFEGVKFSEFVNGLDAATASDVTAGNNLVLNVGEDPAKLNVGRFSSKQNLSIDFNLSRGGLSSAGLPTNSNMHIRVYTKKFFVNDETVTLKLKSGYLAYFYIFDAAGEILRNDETGLNEIEENVSIGCSIRFVFKKSDNGNIGTDEDIVETYSGFSSDDYEYGLDVADIKRKISDESVYVAEKEFVQNSVENKIVSSLSVWQADDVPDDFECENDRELVTSPLKYYEFIEKFYDSLIQANSENYFVTKKSLGFDSSGNYEIFEFDFCPAEYTRVVLLSAGMNACETTAEVALAVFMKNIVLNSDGDEGLKYLHDKVRFKVIPVICPWSFDQDHLKYGNYNGVNINRNFNYKGMWADIVSVEGEWSYKGPSAESEAETKALRKWVSDNSEFAEFYIDCHTDVGNDSQTTFYSVGSADYTFNGKIVSAMDRISAYLLEQGFTPTATGCGAPTGTNYPKNLIFTEFYGVPTMMIEQVSGDLTHGGNGNNCNPGSIKNYTMMLYSYTIAELITSSKVVNKDFISRNLESFVFKNFGKKAFVDASLTDGGLSTQTGLATHNPLRQHRKVVCVGSKKVIFSVRSPYALVESFEHKNDGTVIQHLGSTTLYNTNGGCSFITFSVKKSDNSNISLSVLPRNCYDVSVGGKVLDFDGFLTASLSGFPESAQINYRNDFLRLMLPIVDLSDCKKAFVKLSDEYQIVDALATKNDGSKTYVVEAGVYNSNYCSVFKDGYILDAENVKDILYFVKRSDGSEVKVSDFVNSKVLMFEKML